MQELKVENFAPLTHMDGVLLSFLRAYFQYHPVYQWNEEDAKTKIKISDAFVEVGNESDFTPRIIIRRGNFSLTNPLVVGNYSQSGKSLMSWTQERERNYVAGAVYQISIITKLPLESLNLAEEISSTILMYTERLAEYYNVHIEQHIEVSPENIKTSGTDIEEASSSSSLRISICLSGGFYPGFVACTSKTSDLPGVCGSCGMVCFGISPVRLSRNATSAATSVSGRSFPNKGWGC
jgi:hypothetical protein